MSDEPPDETFARLEARYGSMTAPIGWYVEPTPRGLTAVAYGELTISVGAAFILLQIERSSWFKFWPPAPPSLQIGDWRMRLDGARISDDHRLCVAVMTAAAGAELLRRMAIEEAALDIVVPLQGGLATKRWTADLMGAAAAVAAL